MRRLHLDPIGWHVFARGARRLELYRDDQDYVQFLTFLKYSLKESACLLWAFTLMSNHYHLVLYGSSAQLTACMRRLNGLYSRYHNKRYGMNGHTFDGPYQAYPQPSPLLLLRTVAYVFMNPVVAGLSLSPGAYRWSCFNSYTHTGPSEMKVVPSLLLQHVNDDIKQAWMDFHRAMERESLRKPAHQPAKLTMVQAHVQQFEWLLEHAREAQSRLGGREPELVAMYWGRLYGVTPRAMAKVLGTIGPAEISKRLHFFKKELQENADLAKRLDPP